MVVNTNPPAETAATNLQRNQSASGRSPARPGPADAVPASGGIVETAPAAAAQGVTAASPDITVPVAALQSSELARASILAQPGTAFLAQANLSPATVFKLLQ